MSLRGEVLVAIMNDRRDFSFARDQHWYRIPVTSVEKWLKQRWPPRWLAFYHTKEFGRDAHAINYYSQVIDICKLYRWQLLPEETGHEHANRLYYQLLLEPLRKLPQPILSRRLRRITFICTTQEKFINAVEINDLYDESPLEDLLWAELKRLQIQAERQELVTIQQQNYFLDFAVYCANGKLNIETDGDTWHSNPEGAAQDNFRDNSLEIAGWKLLRFNTHQIREERKEYCLPTVVRTINSLGGVDEGKPVPRR